MKSIALARQRKIWYAEKRRTYLHKLYRLMPQWFSYVFLFLKKSLSKPFHQKSSCRQIFFICPEEPFYFLFCYFSGISTDLPPMYGRSTSGIFTEPSALRLFSRESDQHTRRSDHCIIQCVSKVFAIFSSHADL